jgi:4-hydroxythreonine-4-phosphate dehydrogenase
MGDPAGVGPEVSLKALARVRREGLRASFLLVGSYDHWSRTARRLRIALPLRPLSHPRQLGRGGRGVPVLDLSGPATVRMGRVSAACGEAAVRYVKVAGLLAREGVVDGLVTAPLNKEAIHRAGHDFPGHTELLADLARVRRFAMMMAGGPFRIVLLTIHTSLRDALRGVTRSAVLDKLDLTVTSLRERFGLRRPRVAVAGLNPHAGENGAFGREEIRILAPAVREARRRGWDVTGPHPPDTLFHWASKGRFDAVLALYHDQGLIPFKLAAFDEGVNVTLGLPFVRTSPDHGTAFDIAGKGRADPSSMASALRLAARMASSA